MKSFWSKLLPGQVAAAPLRSVFATQISTGAAEFRRSVRAFRILSYALMVTAVLEGCRTPVREDSFSKPFNAPRVAQLSHEAYKIAWDAKFWARHDLRFAVRPTIVDYEALAYLSRISLRVGWIARKVEKNPASPRVSSKNSYDYVAYDTMMFRLRYQPESFMPSTGAKIQHLLTVLDELAPYYAQNGQTPAR
ncbi:MAG TPA: hypothetical protein VL793_15205 [Patescibacteria group bacterium]|nr:hypothetical protein [Patescibacteria group bacterium]